MQDHRPTWRRAKRKARWNELAETIRIVWLELRSLTNHRAVKEQLNEAVERREQQRATQRWAQGCMDAWGKPVAHDEILCGEWTG